MWYWMEFSRIDGESRMDSRRASFLLYDFVREYGIEHFQVIGMSSEWQNQRIEALYRLPSGMTEEQVEDGWQEYKETWRREH